ncbi:MAG: glycine--tRNA ligase subunit beta [Armatimonadetes bacterium]|nr:glycine--tRNA ligase subunit beta [Armatimonadota bacterium]
MSDLVLEIGTEDLPAAWIRPALAQLSQALTERLRQESIAFGEIRTAGTPRRLVAYLSAVAPRQPDSVVEIRGPSAKQALDADGNFTSAAYGFARTQDVFPEDLIVKRVTGGEYLFVERPKPGRPTVEVAARLLPEIIADLTFPKMMRWGEGSQRFARPIRWLLALYGTEVIPFSLDGVTSGRITYGHRFGPPLASSPQGDAPPNEPSDGGDAAAGSAAMPVTIPDASLYRGLLRAAGVMLDPDERREVIRAQVEDLGRAVGAQAHDEALLEEVTFRVEWPTAFRGAFAAEFLSLPREALVLVMRQQQRYFPVTAPDGTLLPHFIGVRDGGTEGLEQVRAGNERVLQARFADVRFLYQEDLEVPLAERVPALARITYQDRLGTLLEKTERLVSLTGYLCDVWPVDEPGRQDALRAAHLAKADLATGMMRELPQLRGVIGRVYARHAGEPEPVAEAIADHYRPIAPGDALPRTEAGRILSVADRIDTLTGHFAIGLVPTGAQDPYGLHPQAAGLVAILLEAPPLSLGALCATAYALYGDRGPGWRSLEVTRAALLDFLRLRLEAFLAERGVRYDTADAVLDAGFDDLGRALARALALEAAREAPECQETLSAAIRVGSLLRFAARSEMGAPPGEVRIDLLQEEAEQALYGAYLDVRPRALRALREADYPGALGILGELAAPLDELFDNVLVMSDDEPLRVNRLRILAEIQSLFLQIGDLTRLITEAE